MDARFFTSYPLGYHLCAFGLMAFLRSCSLAVPAGVTPVTDFDVNRYLGRWHEVARLDNRFQRGLEQVTATYSLQDNGSIRVENAGWDRKKQQKRTIVGKAKFVADKQVGHLKVSFWGPFYGSYIILYLEADYSAAIVCGVDKNLCWILTRSPEPSSKDLARYLAIAQDHGFAADNFIYASRLEPNAQRVAD